MVSHFYRIGSVEVLDMIYHSDRSDAYVPPESKGS